MGLSLPWHEPVLAKAVRTVYLRNDVLFLYNQLEAGRPPIQTSSRTVCLVLSRGTHFGLSRTANSRDGFFLLLLLLRTPHTRFKYNATPHSCIKEAMKAAAEQIACAVVDEV